MVSGTKTSVCEGYEFSVKSGRSLVDRPFCFDKQARYFLCCSGEYVFVFHLLSNSCIQKLKHDAEVVCVVLNPQNCLQAVTCDSSGAVSYWDFEDGNCLKKYKLSCSPVNTFAVVDNGMDSPCCFYVCPDADAKTPNFSVHFAKFNDSSSVSSKKLQKSVPCDDKKITFSRKGHFFAFVVGDVLTIRVVEESVAQTKVLRHFLGNDRRFTCVSCHPSNNVVATGDDLGRICLWNEILSAHPVQSIMHWHTMPVDHVIFSWEGNVLCSGAAESVLVKWHLQQTGERSKQFLARIGAPILRLCSAQTGHVAVGLADNGIRIVNNDFTIANTFQGFVRGAWRPPPNMENALLPVGLIYDRIGCMGPTTKGCIVTNGRPGQLQFYSLVQDTQLFSLDVVCHNQPPAERRKVLAYTEVMKAAITRNWLATVEVNPDGTSELCQEMCLKFWKFDKQQSNFVLNNCIDFPHDDSVTALQFKPLHLLEDCGGDVSQDMSAVSASMDGSFRVWELIKTEEVKGIVESWECSFIGCYMNFKATALCFSPESGSVLAVAFQSVLTLWQFKTNKLLASLDVGSGLDVWIRQMEFGYRRESRFIVCATTTSLVVIDVICLSVLWSVDCAVSCICCNPVTGYFAVLDNHCLNIYQANCSSPLLSQPLPDSVTNSPTCSAVFALEDSSNMSSLYFLDAQQKLFRFGSEEHVSDGVSDAAGTSLVNQESLFTKIIESTKVQRKMDTLSETARFDHRYKIKLLSGSAHSLPPIKVLAESFISSCLTPKCTISERLKPPSRAAQNPAVQEVELMDIDDNLKTKSVCDNSKHEGLYRRLQKLNTDCMSDIFS